MIEFILAFLSFSVSKSYMSDITPHLSDIP